MTVEGTYKAAPLFATTAQIPAQVLAFSARTARRTAARTRLPSKQTQAVIHFTNVMHDHETTWDTLFTTLDDAADTHDHVQELNKDQIREAAHFIDSLGNGDGEIEIHELR